MKQCEKCQTENYDEAAYCKNCGKILETGKTHQVVKFQNIYLKSNKITRRSFRVLIFAFPLLIKIRFFKLKLRILQYLNLKWIYNNE